MRGLPVTIRLLDPPLHEFLPTEPAASARSRAGDGRSSAEMLQRKRASSPRSIRCSASAAAASASRIPAIYEMQVRAIFEAAVRRQPRRDDRCIPR